MSDSGLDKYTYPVTTKVSLDIYAFNNSLVFGLNFNSWSIVGQLNYLAKSMQSDRMHTNHQIAKYLSKFYKEYGDEVTYHLPHQVLILYTWSRTKVWLLLWCRLLGKLD